MYKYYRYIEATEDVLDIQLYDSAFESINLTEIDSENALALMESHNTKLEEKEEIKMKQNYVFTENFIFEDPKGRGTFLIDVVFINEEEIEIWLQKKGYGIKDLMFGVLKKDFHCYGELLYMIECNLVNQPYIEDYPPLNKYHFLNYSVSPHINFAASRFRYKHSVMTLPCNRLLFTSILSK